jgi:hypothetical protein
MPMMRDDEAKPSLRISHMAHGRQSQGNRVYYLVDPHGLGTLRAVPETVVLRRWRQRQFDGYRFAGTRLSSTLWRAVQAAFGHDAQALCSMNLDALVNTIEHKRPLLRQHHLALPAPEALHALFAVCGPQRLQAILDKHLSPEHAGLSGVPDLFVYAIHQATGRPGIARFVEVKKPEEKVSKEQRADIAFLNALGLHARVLRLKESDAASAPGRRSSGQALAPSNPPRQQRANASGRQVPAAKKSGTR